MATRTREIHRLLQFQLSKFRLGPDYVAEFSTVINEATETHLSHLYQELIAPIRDLLQARHLVLVPHGFLHYVPFHALFDGERFLVDHFTLSYAPSASVYYFCCVKKVKPVGDALVMGVPDEQTPDLLDEVRIVAETIEGARLLEGDEATEEALRTYGQESPIVYIATHAFHRRDNPMFSSIQLGDSELYLFDLYNLKLEAELLVLRGCGANLEAAEDENELVGMTRGFLYAGAGSILATQWDVKGESAALFMRHFFRNLKAGAREPEALQVAMREVRASYPHIYDWAPYVLVGKSDR